ncbi:DNA-binding GntR family transcriptional regulator [Antricoccus suffuscus]|uniref:DNA-binding GntR family transcriptional regulator n=1 Tax=Antricoccus suffuscus TaxID=1629062 RepID=A0A2T1A2H4_9ACTN|nr:GntR family transcriptional regulator [Antricoccus suffuscus]PRZ42811.1 DNA-binding GntR family transcriptional regulator [Antricoccus suffuscus]
MRTVTPNSDPARASELVYATVRREILSGRRVSDSWLREGDIADELGVSRTPVREALRRLTAEGLVRHEFNRGVRVETWSSKQLEEIFSMRYVLEPWACSLAATAGLIEIAELDSLASAMDEAVSDTPDFAQLTTLNNAFHRHIVEGSGNSQLASVIASIIQVPLVHRTFEQYSARSLRRSLAHHHELVDALSAHDPQWAQSVMQSHVRAAWTTVIAHQPPSGQLSALPDPPAHPDIEDDHV